jgi:hypothetical protein
VQETKWEPGAVLGSHPTFCLEVKMYKIEVTQVRKIVAFVDPEDTFEDVETLEDAEELVEAKCKEPLGPDEDAFEHTVKVTEVKIVKSEETE